MSPEEGKVAVLELKLEMLERKLTNLKREMGLIGVFFGVSLPFLLRQSSTNGQLEMSVLMVNAVVILGIALIAILRDRRDAKRDAERMQNIYLSIRPTSQ
ncbi:hypothetical protein [Luteimonas panaciterrae]|uniref:hypothetical protein n=1 Tax=Luteimonas panaciterrae TaxID=363885 RepID=UPI001CFB5E15|nr:hypothetical protein [Luteimonas panaciterrae]